MSESQLPKLIPITRREPPAGYVAPRYDDTPVDAGPAYDEQELLQAEEDRLREAKRHAGYALYTYRWWGLTNIINTIRLWLQARRLR